MPSSRATYDTCHRSPPQATTHQHHLALCTLHARWPLRSLVGVSPGPSGPGQGAALWLWGRRGLLLCFPSTRLPRGRTMPILGGGWSALCGVLRPKVQRPRARGFPRAQLGSKAGTGPAKPSKKKWNKKKEETKQQHINSYAFLWSMNRCGGTRIVFESLSNHT